MMVRPSLFFFSRFLVVGLLSFRPPLFFFFKGI